MFAGSGPPRNPQKVKNMAETLLVTGSNRGIGLEYVRQALAGGDRVIAACRQPAEAAALQDLSVAFPGQLQLEVLDTGSGPSIDAFAGRMSGVPVDVLVNNAGIYGGSWTTDAQRQSIDGMDYALWEEMMRVNVIGPFRLVARLVPNLLKGHRKLVVMMSSDLGSITNNRQGQSHAYRSSKAALNMLTKGLSVELRDQGITVVSMAPGWTRTELGGDSATWGVDDSVRRQREVVARLDQGATGQFINLLGEPVPW
jgi:NAD(P)-dependent dehydrogenase (short-subunit alcohol dehydrogenase family)